MKTTITIVNVDPRELEKQRKHLHRVIHRLRTPGAPRPTPGEMESLEGIVSMLDCWSDKHYK